MEKVKIKKLPHRKHFYNAVFKNLLVSLVILIISLLIGTFGYSYFFGLPFTDSFLNASMILTGMGPVDKAVTEGSKLFAAFYAIYSGVAFLSSVAILFAPVLQRVMHKFHLDVQE